jgi:uncharacterized protein DUF4031
VSVYVDQLFEVTPEQYHGRGNSRARRVGDRNGHRWCHLFCDPDPDSLVRLMDIARAIGMRPEWFQKKDGFPHFDLTPSRRSAALAAGAIERPLADWLRAQKPDRNHLP